MKKTFAALIAFFACASAFAQTSAAGLSNDLFAFGLKAGYQHTMYIGDGDTQTLYGFRGGAFADLFIITGFAALETGIMYQYGTNQATTGTDSEGNPIKNVADEDKVTEHYLQFPIHLKLDMPIGNNTSMVAFAGPSFLMCLKGFDGYKTSPYTTLGFGLGFRFDMCTLAAEYNIGICNRSEKESISAHRSFFNIGVAFNL